MSRTDLMDRAAQLPRRPGAYLFQDAHGKVLYVGKAKDLRHRVLSYFHRGRAHDAKTLLLLREVCDLDYVVTDSEPEALLLELNLIKEHRPRYNIRLRDDKRYPFIKVTVAEALPRAFVTRRLLPDGSRYFGPYTDATAMRETLRALQRVFGVRRCHLRLPRQRRARACLDYYIGRCLGPCVPHCRDEEYRRQVEGMCVFLDGRGGALEKEFEAQMHAAAQERRYEDAARLRDKARALARVRVRQKVTTGDGGERDVVAVAQEGDRALGVVLRVREGRLVGQRHFAITPGIEEEGPEMVSAFLKGYYRTGADVPPEVLVDQEPPDGEALRTWLGGLRGSAVRLAAPRRGGKAGLVQLASQNARVKLQEGAREGFADQAALEELQEIMRLKELPRRVECVDISTSHGREPVGSLVVFVDGRPAKADYRRYRVTYRGEADDPAMMAEVVERRYRRLGDEGKPLPQLVVVDGGRGQLSAARKALRAVGAKDLPLIALAKREEEIYFEDRVEPLGLAPDSEALRLLVRLRNEAHRFAITYHRMLRGRKTRRSRLDEIAGLGPSRKEALLKAFGSVKRVGEADLDDLRRVPGIGPELAARIHGELRG